MDLGADERLLGPADSEREAELCMIIADWSTASLKGGREAQRDLIALLYPDGIGLLLALGDICSINCWIASLLVCVIPLWHSVAYK